VHVNPDWAKKHSPYGATIAYGFQSLAMLTYFSHQLFEWPADGTKDEGYGINYGLDRVRFTAPLMVGQRFRARFTLKKIDMSTPGEKRMRFQVELESEGSSRPVLVAEWLGMIVFGDGHDTLVKHLKRTKP
jgi:acyl dehydratase